MSPLSNELFFTAHRGLNLGWAGTKGLGYGVIDTSNVGSHWSTDVNVAKKFAHRWEDPSWRTKYSKVVHAEIPMSSLEHDRGKLKTRGVDTNNVLNENEITVKEGKPVRVTGVTKLRKSGDEIKSRTRTYRKPREMKA